MEERVCSNSLILMITVQLRPVISPTLLCVAPIQLFLAPRLHNLFFAAPVSFFNVLVTEINSYFQKALK